MNQTWNTELRISAAIGACLLVLIGLGSLAAWQPPTQESRSLGELPISRETYFLPSAEACEAAGGTVQYERTTECFSEPSVYDSCGLGVPCFTGEDGYTCREARYPVCGCASDDQCPDGYYCDEGVDRCYQDWSSPTPDKGYYYR